MDGTVRPPSYSPFSELWCVLPFSLASLYLGLIVVWITLLCAWIANHFMAKRKHGLDNVLHHQWLLWTAWSLTLVVLRFLVAVADGREARSTSPDGRAMSGLLLVNLEYAVRAVRYAMLVHTVLLAAKGQSVTRFMLPRRDRSLGFLLAFLGFGSSILAGDEFTSSATGWYAMLWSVRRR